MGSRGGKPIHVEREHFSTSTVEGEVSASSEGKVGRRGGKSDTHTALLEKILIETKKK